jgi:hypothetical protein
MGRYYNGDIEGKFWFGIQKSDSASRFGGAQYFEYSFYEDDLDDVNEELNLIHKSLGENLKKLQEFFEMEGTYMEADLDDMGITKPMLSDYADLLLGIKIRDCIKQNGKCQFTAEF